MTVVRTGLERLLLVLFGLARSIFLFQGVAFGCAWFAAFAAAQGEAPAWVREVMVSALLLSGTFSGGGFLLLAARRWRLPDTSGGTEPDGPWPVLLGLSLLALSALAAAAGKGLPALWSGIAAQLDAVGFWTELSRPGPSGLVVIPILLALLVPGLVTAAAFCQLALPLALLPLLAARSRLFPTLLALGVACQSALVLGGWLATDTFARLAQQASTAMAAAEDTEVQRVAEQLQHATGVLASTAMALVVPLLGMLAWLGFLRLSGTAAAFFAAGSTPAGAGAAPEARTPARRAPLALAILGACMLLFGASDALRARASYVSSQPAGGGVPRFGSFCFGVGVPTPTDTADLGCSLQDRDAGARGRRHTFAGGALLLALGALLPRLAPRR